MRDLLRSERGQTTAEYILLMAAVISLFLLVAAVVRPTLQRLSKAVEAAFETKLFNENAFHRFPVGN